MSPTVPHLAVRAVLPLAHNNDTGDKTGDMATLASPASPPHVAVPIVVTPEGNIVKTNANAALARAPITQASF
jgi:hypothetical protein